MSLVGTRPILQDELLKYELHHRARIAIKPGITGMWQVSGRSDITDFEEVVRLDTEYISNWNFGLDDYKLISKLNPSIIKGTRSEDGFIFNKDADTMQCPAGHLAIKYRIDKRSNQKKNTRIKYFFDINKCHELHIRAYLLKCIKIHKKSQKHLF